MAAPDALTPREREVLLWTARGLSNRDVADRLSVTSKTVEFHRSRIHRSGRCKQVPTRTRPLPGLAVGSIG